MEKIKFFKVNTYVQICVYILSILCVSVGGGFIKNNLLPLYNNILMVIGFIILMAYQLKMVFWKHYVEINSTGLLIKVNSKKGIRFLNRQIQSSNLNKNTLTITLINGQDWEFDMSNIDRNDVQELHYIIMQKTIQELEEK
ncbi:hypothetical protein KMW28_27890 [Flammeovirga yaeyamensis]|uniref:Uncharacterized protein n=1 Tax=Flammeovirga yaeyamensis TaxID=367791 RepID=A0AAX1NAX3_9BACT|nr:MULTISPECIES: hypothetical protein [Flammeovirga]ANQ52418.1 hypothetical protein MY04_5083 [Flammeovirga sp. MY04]MBB3699892.1 hypothetical protein [Flammeovirga yaeyamensis]NMF38312.1 hypothetical protein [Flammeovirga yaeyamensis]QWG04724.1 hypothetical protein KMW28_27890 [Flammeovirga yaeyamensis]